MFDNFGEFAAIGTALCWSFGSIFFTVSSRRSGSLVVNRLRLVVGLILLSLAHFALTGKIIPEGIDRYHLFWFGLSGIVGFVLGDTLLFKSFVLVGPRIGMLMMSLVPVFGTLIAWVFMSECLGLSEIIAVAVTLTGISWVVLTRGKKNTEQQHYLLGILCGIGGALGQAIGLVLSKKGLIHGYPALTGNIIRIFVATIVIWFVALTRGNVTFTLRALMDKKATVTMCLGALLGPFLGVWLSLIAVQYTYIGIASTLIALPPVFLIPLSHWVFKEQIGIKAIYGTVLAMIGVAMFFLV